MPELDVPIDIDDSTFRDKIALALSRLPQADVDGIVKCLAAEAKTGETKAAHALARLADQAFGRIPQADSSDHGDSEIDTVHGILGASRLVSVIANSPTSTGASRPCRQKRRQRCPLAQQTHQSW